MEMTLRIGSLDNPLPGRAAARLEQFKMPARTARFGQDVGCADVWRDAPAAGGGDWSFGDGTPPARRCPQYKGRDAGFLCGELQTPAGSEIEASHFAHDTRQHRMAERFLDHGEDVLIGRRGDRQKPIRRQAHLRETRCVNGGT